jgi:hypothetical protein
MPTVPHSRSGSHLRRGQIHPPREDGSRLCRQTRPNRNAKVVNGAATIVTFLLLDPKLSLLTDDVVDHRTSQATFRSAVASLVGARFVGVLAAQFLLFPSALLIASVARHR